MLCAEATRTLRLKYAVSASSCRSAACWLFVVERLMLMTSNPCCTAHRRPPCRIAPEPVKPAPSTRTECSSTSGAIARTIPAHAVPCPHRSPSSSGSSISSPSSPRRIAIAPATVPTSGWSRSTPLSRMQTRTPRPVASPSAHSRSTRSGHPASIAIRSAAARGRLHAGSSSSSSSSSWTRTSSSTSSTRVLEQLLELHGRAHVALDLQLARHVRRRRVLGAGSDLLEGLRRRRDRHVGVSPTLVDRQVAVLDVDEPLSLALDVEQVRVVDAGELRLVDARLEALEEVLR